MRDLKLLLKHVEKIGKCIDSCTTAEHLKSATTMVENFIHLIKSNFFAFIHFQSCGVLCVVLKNKIAQKAVKLGIIKEK